MSDIPDYPLDIFTPEAVRNAREVDDALREFAPVVRLADGTHMLGRHEHVSAGLLDWKAFSSTSRPWHDPSSPRPEILLTDDPPRHTQVRKVIADALSPRALERVKGIFEVRAQELLERLRAREGEAIDAVGEVTQAYVFQVLPDILGLPEGFLEDLESLGISREEVDTVMCTHLHFDHVGWNTYKDAESGADGRAWFRGLGL